MDGADSFTLAGPRARRRWNHTVLIAGIGRFGEVAGLGLVLAAAVFIVLDSIALMPSKPPTREELAAARIRSAADWRVVEARLIQRTRYPPFEIGSVWTVRSGRICGLVNVGEAGVDSMSRFYTVGQTPMLSADDPHLYFKAWMDCLDRRWIQLHAGTEKTGFCASKHGRESPLGEVLCDAAGQLKRTPTPRPF
jgi:hypothetical protein